MEKLSHTPTANLYELERRYESSIDFSGTAILKGIRAEIAEREGDAKESEIICELREELREADSAFRQEESRADELDVKNGRLEAELENRENEIADLKREIQLIQTDLEEACRQISELEIGE